MAQKKKLINYNLYVTFINFLLKKGNKKFIRLVVDNVFIYLSKTLKLSTNAILTKIFIKLNSFVEVKKLLIKRQSHTIPFSIGYKRRTYLVMKWIKNAINEDQRKVAFEEKLKLELYNLFNYSKLSRALKIKSMNQNQAVANRSNIHFRW